MAEALFDTRIGIKTSSSSVADTRIDITSKSYIKHDTSLLVSAGSSTYFDTSISVLTHGESISDTKLMIRHFYTLESRVEVREFFVQGPRLPLYYKDYVTQNPKIVIDVSGDERWCLIHDSGIAYVCVEESNSKYIDNVKYPYDFRTVWEYENDIRFEYLGSHARGANVRTHCFFALTSGMGRLSDKIIFETLVPCNYESGGCLGSETIMGGGVKDGVLYDRGYTWCNDWTLDRILIMDEDCYNAYKKSS